MDKAERIILGFFYLVLFAFSLNNVWQYLIKQKMYKSVPMLVSYILLIVFSGLSLGYEFFMGFACGSHDCMHELLTGVDWDSQQRHYYIDAHKSNIMKIGIFWKAR